MWRDSNESRGFVPLLAHKHYIEHFSNFLYRFRGKLYRDNYRYRIIAQPYYVSTAPLTLGPIHTGDAFSCICINILTDPAFWESETDIFFNPGPRVDKSENVALAFSCGLRIHACMFSKEIIIVT